MQNKSSFYERYPLLTVLVSNAVSLGIYGIGVYIMFRSGWVWMGLYILFIIWMEIRLLRGSCSGCYYYGKVCAFGKGRLACLVTKKKEPWESTEFEITWKSMIPDLLVTAIPLITAIILMIINFNWLMLILVIILLLLTSAGNGYVRGTFACKYCKQRELGCPAEKLFDRSKAGQQV